MLKSSFYKEWLMAVRQLSPSMLLFSLTLHGLVLLIPFSLFPERKIPYSKTKPRQEQLLITQSKSSDFFSSDKALVKEKEINSTPIQTIDPQFVSQLPSLPQDATTQTQLPIPEIPTPPTLPPVAPVSLSTPIDSSQEVYQVTDGTAAVVVAPLPTASPKKQQSTRAVKPPVPVTTKTVTPTATPTPTPTNTPETLASDEKESFDKVFDELKEELSLSQEPENLSPTIEKHHIYRTAIGKAPEEVASSVISKLEAQGFQLSQHHNSDSEIVYIVTKNKFTEYITFTHNLDKTGTVIFTKKTEERKQ
jgi:hypothetical protein